MLDVSRAIKIHALYTQFAEPGACFINVHKQVAAKGGKKVFGWFLGNVIFEVRPKVQAWNHHCVWESPEGELFDLTPNVVDFDVEADRLLATLNGTVLFIPDEKADLLQLPDGRLQARLSEYSPLAPGENVLKAIECLKAADNCMRARDLRKEVYWCARASALLGGEIDPYGELGERIAQPFSFDQEMP